MLVQQIHQFHMAAFYMDSLKCWKNFHFSETGGQLAQVPIILTIIILTITGSAARFCKGFGVKNKVEDQM